MAKKQANPFDAIDAVLGEATRKAHAATLLDFAKQNNFRVTSGFSSGGHNSGSMHYQGSPDDPGAIDIDHRNVDYNQLLAAAQAAGYNVHDERQRPKGQAVWGGPHYHLSKGSAAKPQPVKGQASKPASPTLATSALPDLSLPVSSDAQGNPVFNNTTQPDLGAEIESYVRSNIPKPAKLETPVPAPPQGEPSDFSGIDKILAEAATNTDRGVGGIVGAGMKPPQTNFLGDLASHFGNAAAGFTRDDLVRQSGSGWGAGIGNVTGSLVDIGGAGLAGAALGSVVPGAGTVGGFGAGVLAGGTSVGALQEAQRQRLQEQFKGYDLARIGGAGVIGGVTSLPVGGAASTLGRTILKNAAIDSGVNAAGDVALQAVEKGTIDPRQLDLGRTATAAGVGAVGGGLGGLAHGKTGKVAGAVEDLAPSSGFVNRAGQEIIPNATPSPYGFVRKGGEEINPRLTPEEAALLKPEARNLNTPQQVTDLNQAFTQRTAGQPDIIDPRKADIPQDLGNVKTETSPGGIEMVTKAGSRPAPDIAIERGLPDARPELKAEQAPNTINPITGKPYEVAANAPESAQVFRAGAEDVSTAQDLHNQAVQAVQDRALEIQKLGGSTDLAIAQRTVGARIQELEGKAQAGAITAEEATELAMKRASFDGLQQATKNATDAEGLLKETQAPTPRANVEAPPAKPVDIGTAPKPTGLKTSQEIAMERANLLEQQPKDLANVQPPEPKRLPDNPAPDLSPTAPRDLAPSLEIPGQPKPGGDLLDASGRPLSRDLGSKPGLVDTYGQPLDLGNVPKRPQVDLSTPKLPTDAPVSGKGETAGIYKAPGGGEVYTHGRDVADIQQQLAGVKGQLANIADIERHLQTHNPEAVPAIQNILNAGKNSEAAKFSYIAREAPGEPARVRDNFVPTHFTYETIKPSTQRGFLRRKFGSDEAVISHLKQEIVNRGGSVNAGSLQTKGGKAIAPPNQINRLIEQLDQQTGGAYLKSPRVHGINLGETTRSAAGDRGIRLDTITDSSLTGRKVTPEELGSHTYNNQIAPAMKALDDLANVSGSPVFKRAIGQIQNGRITKQTMRELKAALGDEKLAAQFCNVFGIKL